MKVPGAANVWMYVDTDPRKMVNFNVSSSYNQGLDQSSRNWNIDVGIVYKPINALSLSINPGYNASFNELQYVTRKDFNTEDRYVFGSIDLKTVSASLRINFNITPDLTLQYWGQPFVASGKYSDFKYISTPMASEYGDRFVTYAGGQMEWMEDENRIDENGDGNVDYSFDKPDFNVQEFLSNFVVRWEYSPGSSVYLVWNQTRSGFISDGDLHLAENLGDLFSSKSHDIFLVKFSYRFGI